MFGNGVAPPVNRILGADGLPFGGTTPTQQFARHIGAEEGMALPHVLTFSSLFGSAWKTYLHGQHDEALRFSRDDALAMRNDAFVRSLVDERKLAVASLKGHVEVNNPKDPWEKALRDGLTQLVKAIPRQADLTWSGLEALWYGRAGDQYDWLFKDVMLPAMPSSSVGGGLPTVTVTNEGQRTKRRALCLRNHMAIEGDKIGYDYDGTPYILITGSAANSLIDQGADVRMSTKDGWEPASRSSFPKIKAKSADIGYTTIGGRALFLKGTWRSRFRIHTHEALDTSFFQPWKADAIHGVGIRSVIFWYWWLRQEFLANVTDWCARTGLGVRLWYYEEGNKQSKLAIENAAKDQNDKVNIVVPYNPQMQGQQPVEFVDTSGHGADLLLKIVKHVEDYLERYIVGQSMSGGSDEFSQGFGDKGRAAFAQNTKWQITKRDAAKFADTNTTDLLNVIKRWTYPELEEIPVWWVYNVDDPEVGKWIEGAKAFIDMGGTIVEDEARARLGLSAPRDGDATIGGLEALQAKQATSGHVKPPDGMSPGQDQPPAAAPQPEPHQPARYSANLPISTEAVPAPIVIHNHLPEHSANLRNAPERYAVQGSLPPDVWAEIERESKMHGPRAADFIRAVMEQMQHTDSPWEAIQKGRIAFLGGEALHYQERAREAVERAAKTDEERRKHATQVIRGIVDRINAEELERAAELEKARHHAEGERRAEHEAALAKLEEQTMTVRELLEKQVPDPVDPKAIAREVATEVARAIREIPAPVVHVAPTDLSALAQALKEMPAPQVTVNVPEPKPRTVKIRKNKDGEYTAETK